MLAEGAAWILPVRGATRIGVPMLPPHSREAAMHGEVLIALDADPAVSYGTVLAQWRELQGGCVDLSEAKRLAALYDRERRSRAERHPQQVERRPTPPLGPWNREITCRW